MEFLYRAGDARNPSTGAAATSASSESAATRVHGDDGSGYHGESSEAVVPRPASDPDELWRQAAKERIRERILREEGETLALEAEVWRELLEERIPSLRSQLARSAGACTKGSEARAAPAADLPSSLETPIGHEVGSKANVLAASQAKRKTHHVAAASNVSAATSSKKQKPDLTCTVCGITATSEGAMQDHLKGKNHGRKAAKLAPPLTGAGQHEVSSMANGSAAWPVKGNNPNVAVASTVFAATSSNEQKPDLTCTVCGITSTSQKAMQDHLEGKLHRRKAATLPQPMPKEDVVTDMVISKPNASAVAAALIPPKLKKCHVMTAESTISAAASSEKQKQDLTCTVCGITTTGEKGMRDHLKGKAHTRKAAALAQPPPPEEAEPVEHGWQEETEGEGHGAYTPKKFNVVTSPGKTCEVVQMNGFLLCEVCDSKTADLPTMVCHLQGSKHIAKAKHREAVVVAAAAAVASGDPELETAVASGDPELETVAVEVNGLRRVGGFLLCEVCDVKAESEVVMRSHLSGKKHKSKKQKAAVDAGAGGKAVFAQEKTTNKDVAVGTSSVNVTVSPGQQQENKADAAVSSKSAVLNVGGQGNDESVEKPAADKMQVVPSATPKEDGATFSVEPMEVDEHAEGGGDRTSKVEEEDEKVDAEAVETNGIAAAVTGQEVPIQVEGKVFTVLRQADGSLSCELCGQHGCDKDRMLEHLYTRGHWRRARLSEQKGGAGKGGGAAQVEN